jgi:hypothetical protein
MNLLNEHTLRFLFPGSEYETDQRVREACVPPGSSWIASLNS